MTTDTLSPAVRPYVDQYDALKGGLPGPAWLDGLRRAGIDAFRAQGFPHARSEAWKYTSLRELERASFRPAAELVPEIDADALPTVMPRQAEPHRIVFVNGVFKPDLSSIGSLPDGVTVAGLGDVLARDPDLPAEYLGKIAVADTHPMIALNTAFVADGLVLRVGRNIDLDAPIEAVFVGAGDAVCHPRILIVVETGAQATLVEHHVSVGEAKGFSNGVTEIYAGANARLHHYKVQRESDSAYHISTVTARMERDASLDSFTLTTGGKLSRNEIRAVLDGENCEYRVSGAYLLRGSQHSDFTTLIDHAKPHCQSREVVKGVIDGSARAVFQGKIVVREDAQKTDGYQLNRALLLSDTAEIDSKPELEIYADDVKCSHGATAGELDEDQLFYLRARGLPLDLARGLLVQSFVGEAVDEIRSDPVRDGFAAVVADWLARR